MTEQDSGERRYMVFFKTASGKATSTICVTRAGYSTEEDIPQMIALRYGPDAVVTSMIDLTQHGPLTGD